MCSRGAKGVADSLDTAYPAPAMTFLATLEPRPLVFDLPAGFRPVGLYLGPGGTPLEVVVLESAGQPSATTLKRIHAARLGQRVAPVAIVCLWGADRAALCAPVAGEATALPDLERSMVERLCLALLACRDRHEVLRHLSSALPQLDSRLPGVRNSGLFALHELEVGVPRRADWSAAGARATDLVALRAKDLVVGLGFELRALPGPASVLIARDTSVAVAVFLERPQEIEPPSARFDGASPVSYALAQADRENLDYVLVLAGGTLRVYPVNPSVGAGGRGRTETYIELDLDLLRAADAGYLWLLASADALLRGGSFEQILKLSEDYATGLGERLRDRVYVDVVPRLAEALVAARRLRRPSAERLAETYDMTLRVLFRLLFVAYAEDKDLLPLHSSAAYRKHSLKELARHLLELQREGKPFEKQDYLWTEVQQLWKAVDGGHKGWGVPPYNGGLFASDEEASPAGRALSEISLPDDAFGPALSALLLDQTAEGDLGPVDFRSLGVREFGTIYEGLLESELSVATSDLTVDRKTLAYRPAKGRDEVVVPEGRVYLHNASGARKASGAYYTKAFAVEHLLERVLDPALDDHLARLDALEDERDAADRFFDFRVADIAMGSGHFLVAAVDHIERRLSNYLARRPLPGVLDELQRLRASALEALGDEWTGEPIEDARLLRRQIARRCVYGVDLNSLAVELARLSMWIHTFVPGLPLSFLDGNLRFGNSLVGIATFDEAAELMGAGDETLFGNLVKERLARSRELIRRLGSLAETTRKEVKDARRLHDELRAKIHPEEALLSVLAASRVDEGIAGQVRSFNFASYDSRGGPAFFEKMLAHAEKVLGGLHPLHFPIEFPQVFLSDRGGFDVIVGNPPWEEATIEEHAFWARHEPGLRGLNQQEQERRKATLRKERPDLLAEFQAASERAERLRGFLTSGPYPGMGTGDPDVYKAFCWRFWSLVSPEGGRIGVVLPRSALSAKGSAEFRKVVFEDAQAIEITMILNNKQWFFAEVHPQYTIGLVAIQRGKASDGTPLRLRGPYPSHDRFTAGVVREPTVFDASAVESWNDTHSLPLLPAEDSASVFEQLRRAPRLDLDQLGAWRARPQAELHATNDKPLMELKSKVCPDGYWPVFKGESFDLWTPDTGTYYAFANPTKVLPALQAKRVNAKATGRGAFSEFPHEWIEDPDTHPCLSPRIAFRDITNRTNQRTMIVALVPGEVVLTNKAPYFLWPRGDEGDQAYLLGVLSSIPLDWYARRFVEVSVNFFILNPFPIPRPALDDPVRRRVIELSALLAASDRRLHAWAKAAGVKPRKLGEDEREDLVHELDAAVSILYGLNAAQIRHIFETFHEGWDASERLRETLVHFDRLRGRA